MKKQQTVAELWASYKAMIPKNASATQLIETRRAFYAGAQALFYAVLIGMSDGSEETPEDLAYIGRIDQEMREFAKLIADGVA